MGTKKEKIVIGLLIIAGLIIGWVPASSSQDKPITLKLGSIDAVANPANVATLKFAELVSQKTNGKVKIEVYPASQLGTAISQIESIMTGSLDMGQFAVGFFGQYIKDWNVLALAFAFKDHDHLRKFLESDTNTQIKDQFLKQYKVRVLVENFLRPPNVICDDQTRKEIRRLKRPEDAGSGDRDVSAKLETAGDRALRSWPGAKPIWASDRASWKEWICLLILSRG